MLLDMVIHAVAAEIAKRLEHGSRAGAWTGAAIGGCVGVTIALLLVTFTGAGGYGLALLLILGIPGAIGGALLGAKFGPPAVVLDARNGVRVSNYNRAAGPLLVALLCIGFLVAFLFVDSHGELRSLGGVAMLSGIALVALVVLVAATRQVWYVEAICGRIIVRYLLARRAYSPSDVEAWGFEVTRGTLVRESFEGVTPLRMTFTDGRSVGIEMNGDRSGSFLEAMGIAVRPRPVSLPQAPPKGQIDTRPQWLR